MRGEAAGPRREGRDHTDDRTHNLQGDAQQRADPFALVHLTPGGTHVGLHITHADRGALGRHAAEDPLADRHRQRAPLLALNAVSGRLHDVRPLVVEERNPAPAGPDQRRDREADPIEDRRYVEARGDELTGRVQRRQLVGPAPALFGETPLFDPEGQGAPEVGDRLDVRLGERAGPVRGEHDRAENLTAAHQRHEHDRAEGARGENPAAHLGHLLALDVVDPDRRAVGHDARQQGALERHPPLARPRRRRSARRHVDELELTPLGVELRHGEQVEPDELRRALGEGGEQVVDRVSRREHAGDLGDRRLTTHPLLALAELFQRRAQLLRQLRGQRRRLEDADATDEHQLADAAARGAERRPEQRRPAARRRARRNDAREPRAGRGRRRDGRQPLPQCGRRALGAGRDDDRLLASRPERDRAGRRAGQLHSAAQSRGEAVGHRGRREDRRHQTTERSLVLHDVMAVSAIGPGGFRCAGRP